MKINIIIISLLLLIISFKTHAYDKILFEVEGEIFTTIDLNNRIKYLELIGQNNSNNQQIYDEFKEVILFDLYAKKNNIKIKKKEIQKYLNQLKNNDEDYIYQNLKYDLQKKTILEKKLWKKNLEIKNENFNINLIDIYDFKFEYITLEKKYKNEFMQIIKNQENIEFEKIKDLLIKNKIQYVIVNRKINQLENLDQKIKEKLKQKQDQFIIEFNDYILIGKITKNLKKNIDIKLTFYQVITNKLKKNDYLTCINIEKKRDNLIYKIKKFEEIEINKLSILLKNNLNNINDLVLINENENIENYILLCEIKFDEKILNDQKYNNKIQNIVNDIESQIINQINKEFRIIEYD